jgi:hypothetical protein
MNCRSGGRYTIQGDLGYPSFPDGQQDHAIDVTSGWFEEDTYDTIPHSGACDNDRELDCC